MILEIMLCIDLNTRKESIFMVDVFKKHSYTIVKMFVTQVAIAIFGLGLAIATGMAKNTALQISSSILAILFYLFLIYGLCWEVGSKSYIAINGGREKRNIFVGLYMGIFANIPNAVLAILATLGFAFPEIFGSVGGVGSVIALAIEGMYTGLLSLNVAGNPLNSYAVSYFLIMIPSLAVSFSAYLLGSYDKHLTGIFIVKNPELARRKELEKAQKKEEKRNGRK